MKSTRRRLRRICMIRLECTAVSPRLWLLKRTSRLKRPRKMRTTYRRTRHKLRFWPNDCCLRQSFVFCLFIPFPQKYKSIFWGPPSWFWNRIIARDNAHSFACLRLFLRVVCFILDQTIVASDKCLSYARILLFPTGTQYPAGSPKLLKTARIWWIFDVSWQVLTRART